MNESPIVCGFCNVEPKILAYGNGDRELACLTCGQRDNPAHASAAAHQHANNGRVAAAFRWHFAALAK